MRVLIVDDEKPLADALRRGLEANGISADVAFDGAEGLWMAREAAFDAIVLDVMLPKLNGYQVCSALRAERIWTPVLMLTAKDGEHDEADALDLGADDFLSKPFSLVVLVARLRALTRRDLGERPTVLEAGDVVLDPAAHRCWRADEEVGLTGREFAVLELLMRRRGDVVPKLEMLDHVWGFAFDGDPNIIDVYIGYLRKKLDDPGGDRRIETVRGVGYRVRLDNG